MNYGNRFYNSRDQIFWGGGCCRRWACVYDVTIYRHSFPSFPRNWFFVLLMRFESIEGRRNDVGACHEINVETDLPLRCVEKVDTPPWARREDYLVEAAFQIYWIKTKGKLTWTHAIPLCCDWPLQSPKEKPVDCRLANPLADMLCHHIIDLVRFTINWQKIYILIS